MKHFHALSSARHAPNRRQRGAATLVVVMLLFFVISLVAAYASRNLIFEQRTSVNQYHSTQSFEAAEAGLEWAVAMLNSGRAGDDCLPTTDTSRDNFRQRYLTTNVTTGVVNRKLATNIWAACSFNGTAWQCTCPTLGLTAGSLPVVGPAFGVRFVNQLNKPGAVRAEVNGCTSFDVVCITNVGPGTASSCQSTLCSLLASHSGLKSPPIAAVTARGDISGTALTASNPSQAAGGITLHAGGTILASATLSSVPGTPPELSTRPSDSALALPADAGDCLNCTFTSVFGLRPVTYRQQPAAVQVDCTSTCNALDVNTALAANRGRIVWLKNAGGLTIDNTADIIGSAASPVLLVVEGPLTIAASANTSARIYGLVYAASAALNAGEIHGALVSAGNVVGSGTAQVAYEADLLDLLRLTTGSFVPVPGGWRDFP